MRLFISLWFFLFVGTAFGAVSTDPPKQTKRKIPPKVVIVVLYVCDNRLDALELRAASEVSYEAYKEKYWSIVESSGNCMKRLGPVPLDLLKRCNKKVYLNTQCVVLVGKMNDKDWLAVIPFGFLGSEN